MDADSIAFLQRVLFKSIGNMCLPKTACGKAISTLLLLYKPDTTTKFKYGNIGQILL